MNSFHDINRDPRDPRTYGRNNNDWQFFPHLSATPGPSFPQYAERTSLSPKPMHREKVSTIDATTLAVVPHASNNDRDILHVDFYNAFKSFPTNRFNSVVHVNCITSLKRIFSLFKDNDKLVRGNWDEARRRNDELFRDLREKEEKIRQLEFSEAAAKKAYDDGKESVSKMRIDTLRYKTEADKAKNEFSFVTSEKNRLIVAIIDEKDRHMKTIAKYDALNVQYMNLSRENAKLNNDLIKLREKIEQMEAEKVEKHPTPPPQEPASSSHSSRRAEKEKKKAAGEGHKKLRKQKHRDKTAVLEKLKPFEMAQKLASAEKQAPSPSEMAHPQKLSSEENQTPSPSEMVHHQKLASEEEQALSPSEMAHPQKLSSEENQTASPSEMAHHQKSTSKEELAPSGRPSRRAKAEGAKRTSAIYQKPKPKKSTPRQKRSHPSAAAAENDVEVHEEEEATTTTTAPPSAKRGRPSTKI